ncbi:MAG: DUF1822 family protein [Cyanobacteria bacterium J06607_10]
MITSPTQQAITLPITTEFMQAAEQFARRCPFDDKAEQIRQNTLAVCVVNAYFQLLDIPTALAESDSWNPMMQMMANVADLKLPEVGVLSCRVVTQSDSACYIPPEDWHDRAGYIAVSLNEAAQEATLIGFLAVAPQSDYVALAQFEDIEAVIDRVHELRTASAAGRLAAQAQTGLTQLGQWVEGVVEGVVEDAIAAGWQAVDTLINPVELGFAFRSAATEFAEPSILNDISRAKLIDLGIQLGQSARVALVVHLMALDDGRTDIVLQLRPLGESPYLAAGLTLTVLDENDAMFMSATSREIDNYIQLRLSGQSGERFGVSVSSDAAEFYEQFVI